MHLSNCIRHGHRWLSIAFTLTVIANFVAMAHLATATAAMSGKHAAERAALFLAVVAGVQMMRQMLQLRPLVEATPDLLVSLLTPVIAELFEPQAPV